MSLPEEIAAFEAKKTTTHDPDILNLMDVTTADLIATGIAERALAVGDRMPDFTLPDARGNDVRLSDLLAKGPVVMTFYRGGWCPYCNLELRAYQRLLADIEKLNATMVAISPMLPDNSLTTVEKNDLAFPVLSDVGNAVAGKLGLVFEIDERIREIYTERLGIDLEGNYGELTFKLPIPATFVVGADGRVVYAHVDADYRLRADPADVMSALATAAQAA